MTFADESIQPLFWYMDDSLPFELFRRAREEHPDLYRERFVLMEVSKVADRAARKYSFRKLRETDSPSPQEGVCPDSGIFLLDALTKRFCAVSGVVFGQAEIVEVNPELLELEEEETVAQNPEERRTTPGRLWFKAATAEGYSKPEVVGRLREIVDAHHLSLLARTVVVQARRRILFVETPACYVFLPYSFDGEVFKGEENRPFSALPKSLFTYSRCLFAERDQNYYIVGLTEDQAEGKRFYHVTVIKADTLTGELSEVLSTVGDIHEHEPYRGVFSTTETLVRTAEARALIGSEEGTELPEYLRDLTLDVQDSCIKRPKAISASYCNALDRFLVAFTTSDDHQPYLFEWVFKVSDLAVFRSSLQVSVYTPD